MIKDKYYTLFHHDTSKRRRIDEDWKCDEYLPPFSKTTKQANAHIEFMSIHGFTTYIKEVKP